MLIKRILSNSLYFIRKLPFSLYTHFLPALLWFNQFNSSDAANSSQPDCRGLDDKVNYLISAIRQLSSTVRNFERDMLTLEEEGIALQKQMLQSENKQTSFLNELTSHKALEVAALAGLSIHIIFFIAEYVCKSCACCKHKKQMQALEGKLEEMNKIANSIQAAATTIVQQESATEKMLLQPSDSDTDANRSLQIHQAQITNGVSESQQSTSNSLNQQPSSSAESAEQKSQKQVKNSASVPKEQDQVILPLMKEQAAGFTKANNRRYLKIPSLFSNTVLKKSSLSLNEENDPEYADTPIRFPLTI